MNNTNNPSRTNKSSSFVHQRWGNAYGRVWRFSCARYDTQLLRSNITVGREANIHGNYWIDRPIIVVVRPSCSEENITKLVFCGGIYYRIAVLGLFHYQHRNVIQKRITTNLSNHMIVMFQQSINHEWWNSAKEKSETRNLAVPIG